MNRKPGIIVNKISMMGNIISWVFGCLFFAIGIINMFWGNDPAFGVFVLLVSFVYFFPFNEFLKHLAGFRIPRLAILKIFLGILILLGALGVGELFAKVVLMLHALE